MEILYTVLLLLAYLWIFWLLYILVMGLYRASLAGKLTKVALVLSLPILIVAYLVDLIANFTIATLYFRELPRIYPISPPDLVTTRLSRYMSGEDNWRKVHAEWLCSNLLDYFDPTGKHCK